MRRRSLSALMLTALAAAAVLAGCAPKHTRPYESSGESNIRFHTGSDFPSLLRSAAVHIYSVDATCTPTYQGSVALDAPTIRSGIPVGRLSYLVFSFRNSPLPVRFAGAQIQETLLQARWGHRYDVEIQASGEGYVASLREIRSGRTDGTPVEQKGLNGCRPGRGFFRR